MQTKYAGLRDWLNRQLNRASGEPPDPNDYPTLREAREPANVGRNMAMVGTPILAGQGLYHGLSRADEAFDLDKHKRLVQQLRTTMQVPEKVNISRGAISAYNPLTKEITMRGKGGALRLGTLAHELGHASGRRIPTPLYAGGKIAPWIGLFTAGTSSDQDTARTGAIASTALSAPMLAEEFRASRRGSKALKALGRKRFGSFAGLGTYAAAAALPALLYKMRQRRGDFTDEHKADMQSYANDLRSYYRRRRRI